MGVWSVRSGWLVESELCSASAESADWAALMVAVTWSLPAAAMAVGKISIPAIWATGAAFSDRTDIFFFTFVLTCLEIYGAYQN